MNRTALRSTLSAALAVTVLALAGCQTTDQVPADDAEALTVTAPWVKAADEGMTAAFGVVENHTDTDIQVVAARTELAVIELHEMAMDDDGAMVMRRKEGGFTVPAQGTHELVPGGDHLMLMGLTGPVLPGDEVEITLESQEGTTWTFTAPGRTFDGAKEDYVGDGAEGVGGMETTSP